MNRWIVTMALIGGLAQPVSAQKFKGDVVLTLQGGLGVAVGTFSHDYSTAPEFAMQAEYAVKDGTSVGVRGGYQLYGADDSSSLGDMKIANLVLQGKHLFSPDQRAGLYAVGGWGVFWWKDTEFSDLSNAEWGGLVGLGLHYEASDRVAFIFESTYNGFFAEPNGASYFSFQIGAAIGLGEE